MGSFRRRDAFTLIELLVVISIIALLISILLPALKNARESARGVACMSNERQVGLGFINYLGNSDDVLPATWTTVAASSAKKCWTVEVGRLMGLDIRDVDGSTGTYGVIPAGTPLACPSTEYSIATATHGAFGVSYGYNGNALGRPDYGGAPDYKFSRYGCEVTFPIRTSRIQTPERQLVVADGGYGGADGFARNDQGWVLIEYIGYPGNQVGFRHGANDSANALYLDGHVATSQRDELLPLPGAAMSTVGNYYPWNWFMFNRER